MTDQNGISIGNFTSHSLVMYAPQDIERDHEGRCYLRSNSVRPVQEILQIKPANARPLPQWSCIEGDGWFRLPKALGYTCDLIENWESFDVIVGSAHFVYAALQANYGMCSMNGCPTSITNYDLLDRLYKVIPAFPREDRENQGVLKPCGVAGFEKLMKPLDPTYYWWAICSGKRISRISAEHSLRYYGSMPLLPTAAAALQNLNFYLHGQN